MATINAILEGKTGNYFKLEDFGEDIFTIIENIDPAKTEIRTEKVPNKDKTKGDKAETEYYHILCKCGDVMKDLSLTYTALKQFSQAMPKTESWRGYQAKYLGTKGSGKNIKYNFSVVGKSLTVPEQGRLDAPVGVAAIVTNLRQGAPFFKDHLIPYDNVTQAISIQGYTGTGVEEMLKNLKDKGLIIEAAAGFYKVV